MSKRFQLGAIPSGSIMLFQNTVAPVGWVKLTTHNDKALRVVTGTPSSGGSTAFSTVFGVTATDSYTLLEADVPAHTHSGPSHSHTVPTFSSSHGAAGNTGSVFEGNGSGTDTVATSAAGTGNTGSYGGGGGHAHGVDLQVNYVDVILARKS